MSPHFKIFLCHRRKHSHAVLPTVSNRAGPCEEAACVRGCTYVHWQTGQLCASVHVSVSVYVSVSKGVRVCARQTSRSRSGRRSGEFRPARFSRDYSPPLLEYPQLEPRHYEVSFSSKSLKSKKPREKQNTK